MAPIIHIVCFQFKPSLSADEVKKICAHMLDLRNQCIHPTTKETYILKSSGGVDNSPEGRQGGLTHGFVVEFASAEDRDYYCFKDPAHLAFIKTLDGKVDGGRVVDYEPGVF